MAQKYKLALCQMLTTDDKNANLANAARHVREAAALGARVVSLPEMWNCPYENALFGSYAEDDDGPSVRMLADLARENKIWLIGGSVPEFSGGKLYNTTHIFGPDGERLGKYRKTYLFDVDVKGGVSFKESDTISPGNDICVFDTDFGKIGVAICYDVRFLNLIESITAKGAQLIVLPASFSLATGPYHWEILMRARALDFQIYFAACSPARNMNAKYQAYGHSLIVNPWGELCGAAATEETIVLGEIDPDYLARVRGELPVRAQFAQKATN